MAQRQVTTVLQMLAQRQAVQVQAQFQVQVQAQPQHQVQAQHDPYAGTPAQSLPYQSTDQPLTFAQLAARQEAVQQPVQQQQLAYAVNPYLDPDVEMPAPEPFDINSLDYADHSPANPLAGAQHASKASDLVYDQVYL